MGHCRIRDWCIVGFVQHQAIIWTHDDVIKWKHFPRYWPFVRGIHRSPVNSPHKGQWRGALMFFYICTRINAWVNNGEAGDLRRHRAHYDVTVMQCGFINNGFLEQSPADSFTGSDKKFRLWNLNFWQYCHIPHIFINGVLWQSGHENVTANAQDICPWYRFVLIVLKSTNSRLQPQLPGINELTPVF